MNTRSVVFFVLVVLVAFVGQLYGQETDTSGKVTAGITTAKPATTAAAKPGASPTAATAPASVPVKYTPTQLRSMVNREDPFPEKVNRRTPIAFQPFSLRDPQGRPLVDPATGQTITRDTVLTLPNRKRITAGEYIDTLNALEQRYTSLGYSLRERKPRSRKVAIEEVAVDRSKLLSQKTKLDAAAIKGAGTALTSARANQIAKQNFTQLRTKRSLRDLETLIALPANMQPGFAKSWELEMGDEDSFYVNLNGRFELRGSADSTTYNARGRADSEIMQRQINIVNVNSEAKTPISQPLTLSLDVSVLGTDILSLDESQVNGYEKEGMKDKEVRWGREWPFQVGPVPMSVELGVGGRAGVKYYVGLLPVSVNATVTPFAQTYAYAQLAAIEIQVAEAGVEGRITLLNDDLILAGTSQALLDEQQKWYLYTEWSAYNQMETLSGKLGLYACVWVWAPSWNDPTNYEEDCTYKWLWDWEGFKQGDYLFKGNRKNYL